VPRASSSAASSGRDWRASRSRTTSWDTRRAAAAVELLRQALRQAHAARVSSRARRCRMGQWRRAGIRPVPARVAHKAHGARKGEHDDNADSPMSQRLRSIGVASHSASRSQESLACSARFPDRSPRRGLRSTLVNRTVSLHQLFAQQWNKRCASIRSCDLRGYPGQNARWTDYSLRGDRPAQGVLE